jgi:hypothetical protein
MVEQDVRWQKQSMVVIVRPKISCFPIIKVKNVLMPRQRLPASELGLREYK